MSRWQSRRANAAVWRDLESSRSAGQRLRIPAMFLDEAMGESDFAGEWHHVEINGEVRESYFAKPEQWDAVAEAARELRSTSLQGKISREKFVAECEAQGLELFEPYEGCRTMHGIDAAGRVAISFLASKRTSSRGYMTVISTEEGK